MPKGGKTRKICYEVLEKIMNDKNLSQEEFIESINISSRTTLKNIRDNGVTSENTFFNILKTYNLDEFYLENGYYNLQGWKTLARFGNSIIELIKYLEIAHNVDIEIVFINQYLNESYKEYLRNEFWGGWFTDEICNNIKIKITHYEHDRIFESQITPQDFRKIVKNIYSITHSLLFSEDFKRIK